MDAVAALWSLMIAHHAPFDPLFTQRSGSEDELRSLVRATLRDRNAAVLVWDGEAGIAGMCIVRADRAPPVLEETERAEITDLGVREDRRREGIGRALVEAALEWARARGIARAEVRVVCANREAQAFWRALGFGDLMDILHRRL